VHVIEQNLSIVEALTGQKMAAPAIEVPKDCAAEEIVEGKLQRAGMGEFAILNPGAGWGAKQWPAERYGQVARAVAKFGIQSVVNYGPGEEDLLRDVEQASGGTARGLQSSISELIALTRRAKLFVGGDTGPLHLAAALRIPVVGIFGPTDPARNGPYGTRSVVLRNPASTTTHSRNPRTDEAMLAITVEAAIDAARTLLFKGVDEVARD
jgi:heptosyltransferase-1